MGQIQISITTTPNKHYVHDDNNNKKEGLKYKIITAYKVGIEYNILSFLNSLGATQIYSVKFW